MLKKQKQSLQDIGIILANQLNQLTHIQAVKGATANEIQNNISALIEGINRETTEKADLVSRLNVAQSQISQQEEELRILSESNNKKLFEIKSLKEKLIQCESEASKDHDTSERQSIYLRNKDKEIAKLKLELSGIQQVNDSAKSKKAAELYPQYSEEISRQLNSKYNDNSEEKNDNSLLISIITQIEEEIYGQSNSVCIALIKNCQSMGNIKNLLLTKRYGKLLIILLRTIYELIETTETNQPGQDPQFKTIQFSGKYPVTAPVSQQSSPSGYKTQIKKKKDQSKLSTPNKIGPKAVFNPYTKKKTDFFDPYLQYGGKTMYTYN